MRKLTIRFFRGRLHGSGSMTIGPETREASRFCLVGIDQEGLMVPPAGMGDMIGTPSHRTSRPHIHDIKDQGGVGGQLGMQGRRRIPGFIAYTRNELSARASRMEWDTPLVAGYDMPRVAHPAYLDLYALHRGINITRSSPCGGLFS